MFSLSLSFNHRMSHLIHSNSIATSIFFLPYLYFLTSFPCLCVHIFGVLDPALPNTSLPQSTPPHVRLRRRRSFLLRYQRSQRVVWAGVCDRRAWLRQEAAVARWLSLMGVAYPSGTNPWTWANARGRRQGGGSFRQAPSGPPHSGRTLPQRVRTALKSTSPRLRPDCEMALVTSVYQTTIASPRWQPAHSRAAWEKG